MGGRYTQLTEISTTTERADKYSTETLPTPRASLGPSVGRLPTLKGCLGQSVGTLPTQGPSLGQV